jgi:hypothetical protein
MSTIGVGSNNWSQTNEVDEDDQEYEVDDECEGLIDAPKGRASNYTIDEDVLLCNTWLNVSMDATVGTDQTRDTYWLRMKEFFDLGATMGGLGATIGGIGGMGASMEATMRDMSFASLMEGMGASTGGMVAWKLPVCLTCLRMMPLLIVQTPSEFPMKERTNKRMENRKKKRTKKRRKKMGNDC